MCVIAYVQSWICAKTCMCNMSDMQKQICAKKRVYELATVTVTSNSIAWGTSCGSWLLVSSAPWSYSTCYISWL